MVKKVSTCPESHEAARSKTKVPTCRDPREAAKARARGLLERLVPFERSPARHMHIYFPELGIYSSRDLYDWLVARLEREAVDPTPTGFLIDRHGRAAPTWGD
jgi:hypothetical protein